MRIEGQAAIVTGAASGLGLATAELLGRSGARLALLDVAADRVAEAAGRSGGLGIACDVSRAESAEQAVAEARGARARPHPGQLRRHRPSQAHRRQGGPHAARRLRAGDRGQSDRHFHLLRLAAADMAGLEAEDDGERGVIVNTASVAAFEGQIGQTAYAASKGGVAALTLPAARELARDGIRVVAIAPGLFETPMLRGLPEPVQQSLAASVPFPRRLGRPEEYAALVRHIVENPMLNGEVIRLDGALRMPPQ